jgi:hypothetical protein
VIVHNLDIFRVTAIPPKAKTPLIVDPNAELTLAVAFQRFQPIAWKGLEIS